MAHIEEIVDDDIDNMDYDLADFEPSNPFSTDMPVEGPGARLRPATRPQGGTSLAPSSSGTIPASGVASAADFLQSGAAGMPSGMPSGMPMGMPSGMPSGMLGPGGIPNVSGKRHYETSEEMKGWKMLYPCYFDRSRSTSEGRRVPLNAAVENPLAVTIAVGCEVLGYRTGMEVDKMHPKDWANVGRVRVNSSKPKRQILREVAKYLQEHPTSVDSPIFAEYRKHTEFDSPHPIAVPRGMKINSILPGFSPAISAAKLIEREMKMGMGQAFGMPPQ